MKSRGIIFSGPMVRAILDGRKTMTRRLVTRIAPVTIGDELWVREHWQTYAALDKRELGIGIGIRYKADLAQKGPDHNSGWGRWRSSRFMPRWASRITLKVTAVRVERLQDISPEDAIREGTIHRDSSPAGLSASAMFGNFWDTLARKPGATWADNPWIWVIEFERTTP